jgi:hypothetical protein
MGRERVCMHAYWLAHTCMPCLSRIRAHSSAGVVVDEVNRAFGRCRWHKRRYSHKRRSHQPRYSHKRLHGERHPDHRHPAHTASTNKHPLPLQMLFKLSRG